MQLYLDLRCNSTLSPFHVCIQIRVSLKTQNVSDRAPNGGHAVSICRGPPKKNSDFYLNIWPEAQHICVLGRLAGKTRKNGRKYAIFKNWIDTRLKMETHEPNLYSTILGGVSRGFWTLFLDWGARNVFFWHLKTGTFAKSARF